MHGSVTKQCLFCKKAMLVLFLVTMDLVVKAHKIHQNEERHLGILNLVLNVVSFLPSCDIPPLNTCQLEASWWLSQLCVGYCFCPILNEELLSSECNLCCATPEALGHQPHFAPSESISKPILHRYSNSQETALDCRY